MLFEDEDLEPVAKASKRPRNLMMLSYPNKPRYILTREEVLALPAGTVCVFDTELFINYQLIAFKVVGWNGYFYLERTDTGFIDVALLRLLLYRFCLVGFNSKYYDLTIIEATIGIAGVDSDLASIKAISDSIILRREIPQWAYTPTQYNHIDLIEVTPLIGSLKLYGARLHCERMQEMPVNAHAALTPEQIENTREYCFNDLDVTEIVLLELKEPIAMREQISRTIGEDLRSKSDAQIAEAVISHEYKRLTGFYPKKTKEIDTSPRKYVLPTYLQFQTPLLQNALATVIAAEFPVGASGYADIPASIKALRLPMGKQIYQMSGGGLHSSETNLTVRSDDMWAISDFDVASYYPKIVLNGGIYPKNMGPKFLEIYNSIVQRRLEAKKEKRKSEADGLKITVNGTFGKFGNMYSIMYAPELMLYVTLTGQLTLLMLIEAAFMSGFEVINANTDGVVFLYERSREAELQRIVDWWQRTTNLELEKTSYSGYFSRDVNNYMTLKENGEWKTKGTYCEFGSALASPLSRNPERFVCVDAVKAYIAKEVPIEVTIRNCTDIRRFVTIRNVKGGAHKDGFYLGKTVRWYYAEGISNGIYSCLSGDLVANSQGGKPLMQLGQFPDDIDYNYYINAAFDILKDIGYFGRNEQQSLFG